MKTEWHNICRCAAVVLALAAAMPALAAESLEDEARRTGKGVMILQVGSDWCVSGEKVRKIFESEEFRKEFKDRYVFGVYDEMENPTPEVKALNARVESLLIRTKSFPALTCYTPEMKVFAHCDYFYLLMYFNLKPAGLVKFVQTNEKCLAEAKRFFATAASESGPKALASYGQGFEKLLEVPNIFKQMSYFKDLTEGDHGWKTEWDRLVSLDAGGQFGWVQCLRLGNKESVKIVEEVVKLKAKSRQEAEDYVRKVLVFPSKNILKRQLEEILQYALTMEGLDKPLTPEEKRHLQAAFKLASETFWGQFAQGRLLADGEKIDRKEERVKLASRGKAADAVKTVPFPLDKTVKRIKDIKPGDELTERQKLDIARYAALRLIGKEGWQKLTARPGSDKFVRAFLGDRTWLEDLAWNGRFSKTSNHREEAYGPGAAEGAILALEFLVFQDQNFNSRFIPQWLKYDDGEQKYVDNDGRRFITALAINYPDKSEEWLAKVMAVYEGVSEFGMFSKDAYSQPVWCWRMALQQGYSSPFFADDLAMQEICLNNFASVPSKDYSRLPWLMPFGVKNCFGEFHRKMKPIVDNMSMSKLLVAHYFGGTAPDLSIFAAACINAQGIPATTVKQPQGHWAFTYRRPDGSWALAYNAGFGNSKTHFCFWPQDEWQYVTALKSTFDVDREVRHAADRMLVLAQLAEELKRDAQTVEAFYWQACQLHPGHYPAWAGYGNYLVRSGASLEQLSAYSRKVMARCKAGKLPVCDLLAPHLARLAKERGKDAARKLIAKLEWALNERKDGIDEEVDWKYVLEKWNQAIDGKMPSP